VSSKSTLFVSVSALALLAGCQSSPPRPPPVAEAVSAASAAAAPVAAPAAPVPVPERAAQQYAQALQMMKTGRGTDAELELKQLAVAYPQFSGPEVNLGLLYLHDSRLPDAETAFKSALDRSPSNLVAGNELGIVQRRLGKFAEAEATYQRTIAIDPNYAPAHLNLGVLYDLYLAQPQKALDEFQRYIDIAGDNKQVAGWLAELRKRVGTPAAAKKDQPA
jgi:tetratricopeptide (TPR) repeat protein